MKEHTWYQIPFRIFQIILAFASAWPGVPDAQGLHFLIVSIAQGKLNQAQIQYL